MGSFWWYLSAYVHVQTIALLILLLPIPTSNQWKWILNNCIVNFFSSLIGINVWGVHLLIFCPSCIIFLDSIQKYCKYSTVDYENMHMESRKDARIDLLISQRNYYISGAAMTLCIFVPRLLAIRGEIQEQPSYNVFKEVIREVIDAVKEVEGEINPVESDASSMSYDNAYMTDYIEMRQAIRAELIAMNRRKSNKLAAEQLHNLKSTFCTLKNPSPNNTRRRLARSPFSSSARPPL